VSYLTKTYVQLEVGMSEFWFQYKMYVLERVITDGNLKTFKISHNDYVRLLSECEFTRPFRKVSKIKALLMWDTENWSTHEN